MLDILKKIWLGFRVLNGSPSIYTDEDAERAAKSFQDEDDRASRYDIADREPGGGYFAVHGTNDPFPDEH